ncbi:3-keto-5-aminohexanoate cleavage protein [Marinovum sp.]|uniref:3-keto-5-aminohexanoate cleavage protein n=1 Tax=Marinovum sp. TaxID=2024839 RepID=UPI003A901BDF
MTNKVILTCAVTGAGAINSPHVPITPEQIANSAIRAAEAGATIVHLHVRDPETGAPSMRFDLYKEVVERIRASQTDVILNLTGGAGSRFIPDAADPSRGGEGTTLATPAARMDHILCLKPEIATIDVATINMGENAIINTPEHLRQMARMIRDAGAKPEIEVFDIGGIRLAAKMLADGDFDQVPLFQIVLGVPWTAGATAETMQFLVRQLPDPCHWAAFGISRFEFPMLAQALILGGHIRVGMEDNVYLSRGELATENAQLVERAVQLSELLGHEIATPSEAREILGLRGTQ